MDLNATILVIVMSGIWAVLAYVAYKRWIGYQWTMLFMAILFSLLAGVAYEKSILDTIVQGALLQANTIITYVFATMLARSLLETGIVEAIIKKMIELGGGNPFTTVCLITAAWSYMAPSIPGVAGVIIVGCITLPVMTAMGIKPNTAATIHLLGTVISWPFWTVYWPLYQSMTTVNAGDYIMIPTVACITAIIFSYAWIVIKFKKEGYRMRCADSSAPEKASKGSSEGGYVPPELAPRPKMAPYYSFIVPAIPIILIVYFKWNPLAAFAVSIVPALILAHPGSGRKLRDYFTMTERITYLGFADAAPIGINLIAVGWLVYVAKYPELVNVLQRFFAIPAGFSIQLFLILAIFIVFALFRGFGHPHGAGAITATALVGLGAPPTLVLAWVFSTMIFHTFQDPTFAYNVWTRGYLGLNPMSSMGKFETPWAYIAALVALIANTILLFPTF